MKLRGRMQEGMVADITIFDPATVTDRATYAKGSLPTTGIPWVVVNGVAVVQDSEVVKDVNPGQPLRFAPEAKGRYVPLDPEAWRREFLAAEVGLGCVGPVGVRGPSGSSSAGLSHAVRGARGRQLVRSLG